MKQKNTFTLFKWVLMLFVLITPMLHSYGQAKVLAKFESQSDSKRGLLGIGGPAVVGGTNINQDNDQVATLYASPGLALVISKYNSHIIASYEQPVGPDQWSYIELDGDQGLFDMILGGSLGNALGALLDNVLFGSQNIVVSALDAQGNAVFTTSSNERFSSNESRLFVNGEGKNVLAIKPTQAYQKIKIENKASSVVGLLNEFKVSVSKIYTLEGAIDNQCGKPIGTSFDGTGGLGLTLLDVNNQNLGAAIDSGTDFSDTYSNLKSSGLLSLDVGVSLSQIFYFPNVSNADATFNVTLGFGSSALNLELLGGVEISAYNGHQKVYTKSLGTGLVNGIDLLGLLQSNQKATIVFMPGTSFDRIEVKANGGLDLSLLSSGLRIYDVQRFGGEQFGCENPLLEKPDQTQSPFYDAACVQESGLVSFENVDFPYYAVDGNNESFAVLTAANSKLLGIVGNQDVSGMIHMSWGDSNIPANTPTYIRIDTNEKVLNALLGGALGNLVEGVGNLLLGQYFFEVDVFQVGNSQSILSGNSKNSFGDNSKGSITVVQDNLGRFYLKVAPNTEYNSIKITNKVDSGLVSLEKGAFTMKVYDMCRENDLTSAMCGRPISTSFDATGINISLLGGLMNNNFHYAINEVETDYSSLQADSGILGVNLLGSVSQSFDFATASEIGSSFNLTLQFNKSIVGLDLLGGVEILAYNGTNLVYTMPLSNGLIGRTDLLGLLERGEKFTVAFGPSQPYDRIEVKVNQGVGLNLLGEGLRIYNVQRYGNACPNPLLDIKAPSDSPFENPSCSSILLEDSNVDFGNLAVDQNNESYATLVASNGPILNVGGTQAMIHMGYGKTLAANTTSYIRIDSDKDLLDALLSGSLGKVVAGVGEALLGSHVITVQAYNDQDEVLKATSGDGFESSTNGGVTLVQDNIGRYYLAVSPNTQYNSVKISTKVSGLLGAGGVKTLKVFNMCYETGMDICFPAQFTSYTQSGLNLGLGSGVGVLEGAGVTNAYYAIDGNSSNYSQITAGTLGVGASVRQMIYFSQPSLVGDELKVRIQSGNSGVLNLELLGGYKVITYLGNNKKEEFTFQQGILNGFDLLALFKAGGIQTLSYETTQAYDRVEVVVTNVASVNTSSELRLYDVKRVGPNCPELITAHPFEEPVCATEISEFNNVSEVSNLVSDDFDAFATLHSGAGFIVGIGSEEGILELGYDHTVPAGVTSYIRFDLEDELLEKLVSGSLGNIVKGVLGSLIIGNHYFTLEVKDPSGAVILDGNSLNPNSQIKEGIVRIMIDKLGRSYLAVTPSQDYKSVRIVTKTNAAIGLGTSNSMNVYGMCYESVNNTCQDVFATSYELEGVDLGLEGIGNAGVTNPERAIDDNSTNFSQLSVGTLGVGSKVTQWFYFNTDSAPNEIVNIRFKTNGGTANLDLLGKLKIVAYKGDTQVDQVVFGGDGIVNGVNVLDLIQNGQVVDLPFSPMASYDRISISLESLVGVNVGAALQIYDVSRTCQNLDEQFVSWKSYTINGDKQVDSVTGGEEIAYSIHVKNTGDSDIEQYTIQDVLPAGLTFVSGQTGPSFENGIVTFTNPAILAAGQTQTFTFKATVNQDLDGIDQIVNIAQVQGDLGSVTNSYPPVDNTADLTQPDTSKVPGTSIAVKATDKVSIKKLGVSNNSTANSLAGLDDILTYTITVTNQSNKTIRNFKIEDEIQNTDQVSVAIIEADQGVIAGDVVTYFIGELKAGESKEVTLSAKVINVPSSGEGEILNFAKVEYYSPINGELTQATDQYRFQTSCELITNESFTVSKTSEGVCPGEEFIFTASADSKYANAIYRWYSDKEMTDLLETANEFKAVAFSGVSYYVTMEADGYCFVGEPKQVDISFDSTTTTSKPTLTSSSLELCSGSSLEFEVTPGADSYQWYFNGEETNMFNDLDEDGNVTKVATQSKVTTSIAGTYKVRAKSGDLCLSEFSNEIVISELPAPVITFDNEKNILTNVGSKISLPKASASNSTIQYLRAKQDGSGEYEEIPSDGAGNRTLEFNEPGTFIFYVIATATNGGCQTIEQINVTVFDPASCPPTMVREYATTYGSGSILTGGVSNKDRAVDGRPDTYATITTGVGLLGIGTTWLNLYFPETMPAGTPVTIKLGKEYSGLVLAGGLSVVGIGENNLDIGVIKPVKGGLLDLLAADNVVEFTFVPSNSSGPKPYKGVRISQGSLLGVAQNAKVYGAYVTKEGPINCEPVTENTASNVLDVLHGVKDIGLGVASATASVSNPWNAVDNDMESYAMISRGVAVLNQAFLNVVFKQQATPGDQLEIVIEKPLNPVLSLELIKGFTIQRYLGDTKVGPALDHNSGILNLKLLGLLGGYNNRMKIVVAPFDKPYDRVEISYGSVVGVLGDFTKVYDVRLVPRFHEGNEEPEDVYELCDGGVLHLTPFDGCTTFQVYTTQDGTDLLPESDDSGNRFDISALALGNHTLWVQSIRNGCEVGPRVAFNIYINESPEFNHYLFNGEELTKDVNEEYAIKVHRGDKKSTLDVMPVPSQTTSVAWEMETVDPQDQNNTIWVPVAFADVDQQGKLTMNIPRNGRIDGVDYSGKIVKVRALLISKEEGKNFQCSTYGDIIQVEIAKRSNVKSNLNVTQQIK
ncbi:COG1361 family protein [Myroides sp. LJL119]